MVCPRQQGGRQPPDPCPAQGRLGRSPWCVWEEAPGVVWGEAPGVFGEKPLVSLLFGWVSRAVGGKGSSEIFRAVLLASRWRSESQLHVLKWCLWCKTRLERSGMVMTNAVEAGVRGEPDPGWWLGLARSSAPALPRLFDWEGLNRGTSGDVKICFERSFREW